ncbi:Ap3d1 protein [Mycena filopes]|nr:Ap3d1 protein [Mycena filopes]
MWERTLQDLIRGLRANKKDESKFIAKAVDEIRKEIKGEDMELKAGAILKLTYLDMLGYDMSWASFHVVEVMSSPRFTLKSVGYLAAVQSFDQETDFVTALTARPDFYARRHSVTLNGLSHIVTPDLARDLAPELITMLTHSRAQIRKRAILALYKVMVQYPDVLPQGVTRLKEKWMTPILARVVASTVNPRLVRKLQPPITELISTTPAISLLYECVHTCIIGGMLQGSSGDSLAKMCVSKLAAFIQDADQNLKYIALLALVKIVPSHPHLVAEYQDTILASVNDQDISIRMRALDLVTAMVSPNSLQSIVQQVLSHLVPNTSSSTLPTAAQSLAQHAVPSSPTTAKPHVPPSQSPAYRLVLSQRILTICSQSMYENVTNFEWYLSVLVDLAHVANRSARRRRWRVKGVRRYAVKLMYTLLCDDTMLHNARDEGSCSEVLWAAAWICGEYCRLKLLPYLLQPEIATLLPEIIAVYIQSTAKIFGHWAAEVAQRWDDDDLPEVKSMVDSIIGRVREFVSNPHVEVQERAANTLQLFSFINADLNAYRPKPVDNPFAEAFPKSLYLLEPLHGAYELNPVALAAQASVPIPEGLDLDAWIARKAKKGKAKEVNGTKVKSGKKKHKEEGNGVALTPPEDDIETPERALEREQRLAERRERLRDDPYYIIDDKPSTSKRVEHDVDSYQWSCRSIAEDSGTTTPVSGSNTPTRMLSSFPQYEVDDEVRTSTPTHPSYADEKENARQEKRTQNNQSSR